MDEKMTRDIPVDPLVSFGDTVVNLRVSRII